MKGIIQSDLFRKTGKKIYGLSQYKYLFKDYTLRYLYYHRKINLGSKVSLIYIFLRSRLIKKYGLEILNKEIGDGLYIGHGFNITINPKAVLGENCNIHKGVTIGQENRGKRKGNPKIGDCVWIGANSSVVGNIEIGSNVLIASNSFVNFDVPNNSIVIGNPAKIIPSENATLGYINNVFTE